MKKKTNSGFTLVEVIVSILIIIALAGLLTPVFNRMKRSAEIRSSIAKLHQLGVAVSLYRTDYGGEGYARYDSPNAYYGLALPPLRYYEFYRLDHYGADANFLPSPCGADQTIFDTFRCGVIGWITYVAPEYEPALMKPGSGNLYEFHDYLATYRENAVLFIDPYCNPPGTIMGAPYIYKRGLSVLISGQVVNRYGMGYAGADNLRWYSDPPE
ncbi:MAG TPA: type II secretion system protein [Fimbriimonadales bacterium]|nr:type II secretion system protein [Fimbriimonadales bacterium]